ncbi:uroporphyrinogen-III C-methyltransferase [Alkalihalobacillus sp. FSL R5-0424]
MQNKGFVSFVGAGPGDAGLLTVKALKRLKEADVILYDRLVNPILLEHCHPHAQLVYCGKLPDRHLIRQESINELLVTYASEGKQIVRLKGGDPGVFGRVGEEAQALEPHQIPYEIIPGITSGIGAPLYAGIPVTYRNVSTSFAVVTGHNQTGTSTIDWQAIANGVDTLAFYMGVKKLDEITANLMLHGRSPNQPVKVIQWGTLGKQRSVTGSLSTIVQKVREAQISNPAITLVGDVAGIGEGTTSWFESQPLFNTHVLLARSSHRESIGADKLRALGADVFEYPRWQLKQNELPAIVNFSSIDQIQFDTVEAVEWFFDWLFNLSVDMRDIQADIFAKTKASLEALAKRGVQTSHMEWNSERPSLILGESKPVEVKSNEQFICTHQLLPYSQSNQTLRRLYDEERIEVVVIPNAKSVGSLVQGAVELGFTPEEWSSHVQVVCFGQASEAAAKKAGFSIAHTLNEPSWDVLTDWLLEQKRSWVM